MSEVILNFLLMGVVRFYLNSSGGRVVRASAFGAADSGLIPSWVKPMTL